MFVRDQGHGEPVLLLHGAPSNATALERLERALLERGLRVLRPDLPGYGDSPPVPSPRALDAVAEALLAELERRDVRRCFLVGYSFGAYRALQLALSGRLEVRALVSIAGFARFTPEEREAKRQTATLLRTLPDFESPQIRALLVQTMVSAAFAQAHPEALPGVAAWLDTTTPEVLAEEQDAAAECEDLLPRLTSLRCRITAICGTLDVAAPLPRSEELVAALRHAELVPFAGAGHALPVERPAELEVAVLAGLGL